jgi:hypothetical protein
MFEGEVSSEWSADKDPGNLVAENIPHLIGGWRQINERRWWMSCARRSRCEIIWRVWTGS